MTICFRALPLRVTAGHPTPPVKHRTKVVRLLGKLGTPLIILKTARLLGLLLIIRIGIHPILIGVVPLLPTTAAALLTLVPLLMTLSNLVIPGVLGGGGVRRLGALATGTTLLLNIRLVIVRSALTPMLCRAYLNVMNTKVNIIMQLMSNYADPSFLRLVPGDPPILTKTTNTTTNKKSAHSRALG